jgi:serine/threonine-protein kinase
MSLSASDDEILSRARRRIGGTLCDRYSLSRLIGLGGMGAVYAGVHRNGHSVAVKILHERFAANPEIERLFRREAHLANSVGHPGVVPVIDDDVTEDGCIFLVMPLLRGETLRARALRLGKRLPLDEVLVAAGAILETLSAAHANRVVHRDIKPENVFVTALGEIRVLDFGIGRFFQSNESVSATRSTGFALGTPAFMAPEQARGKIRDVDGRTDIWAVGATMFTLLSGRFVHDVDGGLEMAVRVATEPPASLSTIAPAVPPLICAVVDRALRLDRAMRWPSTGAMAQALREAVRACLGVELADLPKLYGPEDPGSDDLSSAKTRVSLAARIDAPLQEHDRPQTLGSLSRPYGEQFDAPNRSARRLGPPVARAALAVAAMALGVFIIGRLRPRLGFPVSAAPVPARANVVFDGASPSDVPVDLAALMVSPATPSAEQDYLKGIQQWRGAASLDSIGTFASAAKADPAFAAAHLWYLVAADYVSPSVREHFTAAVLYRVRLTTPQLELLEAIRPSMTDPPALSESALRVAALLEQRPDDQDLRLILARLYYRLGDTVRGLQTIYEQPAATEHPLAASVRASFFSRLGDDDKVRATLDECINRSSLATDCLNSKWALDAHEGRCTELEATCRQLLAIAPSSALPFDCLIDSLYSSRAPESVIRAATEEQLRRVAAEKQERWRAAAETHIAIAEGRLGEAEKAAQHWQAVADDYQNPSQVRGEPYVIRVELDVELGRLKEALAVATQFSSASRSWLQNDNDDLRADATYLRSLTGSMTLGERTAAREQILAAGAAPSYGSPLRLWINAYGATAWTSDEAKLAVAKMGADTRLAADRANAGDYFLWGRVLSLAGEYAQSRSYFSHASRSCALEDDFDSTRAMLHTALLTSESGIACGLLSQVIDHWTLSPESKTVRAAKKRRDELACNN